MGPLVGGDRVNPRVAEGLAAEALAVVVDLVAVDLAVVDSSAVELAAAAIRSEAPRAGLWAVVFLDVVAAAVCQGLLRVWVGHQAVWAALAACQARRREWGVGPAWPVTSRG